ncbi:MAG: LPXTG cell wall anchor domain-containing protein [Clostridiales Family XIII bacterium]|jgi:LPXTG-motif cell wall-anchored protein|nr:LPXTG cell wall anchor domain-containing protein [Clostridiales Family XIII bacterium]
MMNKNRLQLTLLAAAWLLLATGSAEAATTAPGALADPTLASTPAVPPAYVSPARSLATMALSPPGRTLPPGVLIADDKGISVARDGAYFLNADKLRPGEVVTKRLTIKNENKGTPLRIALTAQPGEAKGRYNLLDRVKLDLAVDGKTLYSGRVRGDAPPDMTKAPLPLGTWGYGDSRELTIRLTVDEGIQKGYGKSEATFHWTFSAERDAPAAGGQAPKTGDDFSRGAFALGLALSASSCALVAARNRRGRAR